jgi:hypothetical protein
MSALRRWLFGSSVLAVLAFAPGCSSSADEGDEEEGALAEDSGKIIQTGQSDLLLYQGYNTLFDQGHNGCVTPAANLTPQVGDVGVDVKIALVRSRDELARSLGFDTDLSFKVPKAGADARAQVMNSFKKNSTSTTLLVRVGAYYFIDAGQSYSLSDEASALLQRDPRGFLQRCGDAAITKLQYRAEVIGLMKFDTNDQETTTKATGGAGVDVPAVGSIADAKAKVSGSVDKMKASSLSTMNLELYTQGFTPGGDMSVDNLQGDAAMAKLGELLKRMGASIDADRARDVEAVKAGKIPVLPAGAAAPPSTQVPPGADADKTAAPAQHNVIERAARLGAITFQAYAKTQSTSMAPVQKYLQDANKYLLEVGEVQSRLENTYSEEVNAFLSATDQETYNLASSAKATVPELEPFAQKYAGLLKPTSGSGTVAGKLKDAELDCVRMGISGDFSQCAKNDATAKLIAEGNKQLEDYNAEGRVVRMNILYGSAGALTVDNAKAACEKSGGRLPYDTEMDWLRPALAAKGGMAWVMSQKCEKSVGIFTGKEAPKCYNGWYMDWYDAILDATGLSQRAAPVFCVAKAGPRGALSRPGE